MRARWRPLVAVLVGLALVAAACGGSSESGTGTPGGDERREAPDASNVGQGGSATVLQPVDATSLDPAMVINSVSQGASPLNAIYDVLYTIDPVSNELEPQIATDFTTDDGRTWTLTLNEGVAFSDGTPYDAEAVKVNWERAQANPRAAAWPYMQDIESMTAVDATTLQVVLIEPNHEFRWLPTWSGLTWIASPTALAADGDAYGSSTAVGAGPFKLERRTQGAETVLVRNETYWQEGLPKLDTLTLRTVLDPQQAFDTLTTGGAEAWVSAPDNFAMRAEEQGSVHLLGVEQVGGAGWLLNGNQAPFDDIRARQAIYHAADQQALIDTVAEGYGEVPASFLPESSPFYDESQVLPERDPAEAQRLLDELAAEGKPLSFTIVIPGGDSQAYAVGMQTQLSAFDNLDVAVEQLDGSTYGLTLYQGQFELAIYGMGGGHPEPQIASVRSTHAIPIASHDSSEIDALVAESRAASDETARTEAYDKLVKAMNDEYRLIYRNRNYQWAASTDQVAGLVGYGQGSYLFDSFGRMG